MKEVDTKQVATFIQQCSLALHIDAPSTAEHLPWLQACESQTVTMGLRSCYCLHCGSDMHVKPRLCSWRCCFKSLPSKWHHLSTTPEVQTQRFEATLIIGEAQKTHGVTPCAGYKLGLPLPYRGQPTAVFPSEEELSKVPAGICRAILKRNRMLRGSLSIKQPMPHAGLGLPAYIQVTSPIRRYGDLIAHWQLKVIPPSPVANLLWTIAQCFALTPSLGFVGVQWQWLQWLWAIATTATGSSHCALPVSWQYFQTSECHAAGGIPGWGNHKQSMYPLCLRICLFWPGPAARGGGGDPAS